MIRDDVVQSIRENLLSIGLKEMKTRVGRTFFDMEHVVETLFRAFVAGKNVILYGPGGFGKTTILQEFMNQAVIKYSVVVGYEDMDVEGLLGIPDMNKLMNESTYQIAFDKTVFTNPGILILEEFLDVNPKTAIALKDIITSNGYRYGDTLIESHIASVVICSNKSPYELSVDHSTTAFYRERFPIVLRVDWTDHTSRRYLNYIKKITSEEEFEKNEEVFAILAELAYRTSKLATGVVSPRIVKDAVEFLKYNDYSIENLKYIDGLDTSILKEVRMNISLLSEQDRVHKICDKINDRLIEIVNIPNKTTRYLIDFILEVNAIKNKLETLEIKHIESVALVKKYILKCENTSQVLWDGISNKEVPLNHIFNL